jgi:hypothetical protein
MAEKPKQASEYKSEQVELVRATCLYVVTKLGDMMDEDAGNSTRQRWVISNAARVTVDFMIQPTLEGDKGGTDEAPGVGDR